jgi:hypothetical protein
MTHKRALKGYAILSLSLAGILLTIGLANKSANIPSGILVAHPIISASSNAGLAAIPGIKGIGTEGNPYIIEDFDIDGAGTSVCIKIQQTTDYLIIRNSQLRNGYKYGIFLDKCKNVIVSDNTFISANFYFQHYDIEETTSGCTLDGNTFSGNPYAGYVTSSGIAIITNNNIIGSSGLGYQGIGSITYTLIGMSLISGNTVDKCSVGISAFGGAVQISENLITNCLDGITIQCLSASVIENTIRFATRYGVASSYMGDSPFGPQLLKNTITSCDTGLRVDSVALAAMANVIQDGDVAVSVGIKSKNSVLFYNYIDSATNVVFDAGAITNALKFAPYGPEYPFGNYWGDYTDNYPAASIGPNHVYWNIPYNWGFGGRDPDPYPLVTYPAPDIPLRITSNSQAGGLSDSGSGTEIDPYVIEMSALSTYLGIPSPITIYGTPGTDHNIEVVGVTAHVIIRGVNLYEPAAGKAAISVFGSTHVTLEGIEIQGSPGSVGVLVQNGAGVKIKDCVFDGFDKGVQVIDSTCIVENCILRGSTTGFQASGSSSVQIIGASLIDNDVWIRNLMINSLDPTASYTGLLITGSSTALENTGHTTITDCLIDSSNTGLRGYSTGRMVVSGGAFAGLGVAISVEGDSRLIIEDALFEPTNTIHIHTEDYGAVLVTDCQFMTSINKFDLDYYYSHYFIGNYYSDYFIQHPTAITTSLDKLTLAQPMSIDSGFTDGTPMYFDNGFPNTKTVDFTSLILGLGFNPLATRVYVNGPPFDGSTQVTANFVPPGILYRLTIKELSIEVTL